MDIKEFYPSITEDMFENVITLVKTFIWINDVDLRIVKHCRKLLPFSKEEVWKKKSTTTSFNITMGSYDSAKICEFVSVYIWSQLEAIYKNEIGLYYDDGLVNLWGANLKSGKTSKNITEIFKNTGFLIDVLTSLKEVNFLDVAFNLTNGTFNYYK